jgi:hypothetical protein
MGGPAPVSALVGWFVGSTSSLGPWSLVLSLVSADLGSTVVCGSSAAGFSATVSSCLAVWYCVLLVVGLLVLVSASCVGVSLGSVLFSCLQAFTEYGVVGSVLQGSMVVLVLLLVSLFVCFCVLGSAGSCCMLVSFFVLLLCAGVHADWIAFLSLLVVCAYLGLVSTSLLVALLTSDTSSLSAHCVPCILALHSLFSVSTASPCISAVEALLVLVLLLLFSLSMCYAFSCSMYDLLVLVCMFLLLV